MLTLSVVLLLSRSLTLFAVTYAFSVEGIFLAEHMAAFTSNFSGERTTPDVFNMCDWFQVVRVTAPPDSTRMTNFVASRDRSNQNFVNRNMGKGVFALIKADTVTSPFLYSSSPEPAGGGLLDLGPDRDIQTTSISSQWTSVIAFAAAKQSFSVSRTENSSTDALAVCQNSWIASHAGSVSEIVVQKTSHNV